MPRHKKKKRAAAAPAASAKKTDWLVGDLVVAKLRGHRPWPAQIQKPEDYGYESRSHRIFVTFFGTEETCFCSYNKITPFTSAVRKNLAEQLQKINTNPELERAIKEIFAADDELKLSGKSHAGNQKEDEEMASEKSEDEEPQPVEQRSRKRARVVEEAVAPVLPLVVVENERPAKHEKTVKSMAAEHVQKLPRKVRIKVSTQGNSDLASVSSSQQPRQIDNIPPLRTSEPVDSATMPMLVKNGDTTTTTGKVGDSVGSGDSSVTLPSGGEDVVVVEVEERIMRHTAENGVDAAAAAEKTEDDQAAMAMIDDDGVEKMELDDVKPLVSKPSEPAVGKTSTTTKPSIGKEDEVSVFMVGDSAASDKVEDSSNVSAKDEQEKESSAAEATVEEPLDPIESRDSSQRESGAELDKAEDDGFGNKVSSASTEHDAVNEEPSTEDPVAALAVSATSKEEDMAEQQDRVVVAVVVEEAAQVSITRTKDEAVSRITDLQEDCAIPAAAVQPSKVTDHHRVEEQVPSSETEASRLNHQAGEAVDQMEEDQVVAVKERSVQDEGVGNVESGVGAVEKVEDRDGAVKEVEDQDGAVEKVEDRDGAVKEVEDQDGAAKEVKDQEGVLKEVEDRDGAVKKVEDRDGAAKEVKDQEGVLKEVEDRDGALKEVEDQDGAAKEVKDQEGVLKEVEDRDGAAKKVEVGDGVVKEVKDQEGEVKEVEDRDGAAKKVEDEDGGAKKTEGQDAEMNPIHDHDAVKKTEDHNVAMKETEDKDRAVSVTECEDGGLKDKTQEDQDGVYTTQPLPKGDTSPQIGTEKIVEATTTASAKQEEGTPQIEVSTPAKQEEGTPQIEVSTPAKQESETPQIGTTGNGEVSATTGKQEGDTPKLGAVAAADTKVEVTTPGKQQDVKVDEKQSSPSQSKEQPAAAAAPSS